MNLIRRVLCAIGWHDWEYVGEVYGFYFWKCRRCGKDEETTT